MKLITFAVPSYNSEGYMRKCIDSLLTVGDDCEIIIVNDGSKDGTAAIADEYAAKYPDIVIAHHKPNGGHGSGVNAGIALARGLYYKVVDSDDWIDAEAMSSLTALMKNHIAEGNSPDLYITNYVYERAYDNTSFTRDYRRQLPSGEFFEWDKVGKFKYSEMMMMHSLWYKTDVLRASGLILPEHTFYVDDIFCYTPLPSVSSMYYHDADIYRYFIGRPDQSVNIEQAGKNYRMMLRVMTELAAAHDLNLIKKQSKQLYKYMMHCLYAFMMVTATFASAKNTKESKSDFKAFWKYLKKNHRPLFRKFTNSYNLISRLPWPLSRRIIIAGYKSIKKRTKLG